MHIYNWCHSNITGILMYTNIDYNIHGAIPLLFVSPCWIPFAPPSNPLYLLGNPPSCDRIRPLWSQVACKLTSPFSTLSPIPPPSTFPEPRLSSASLWRPQESGFFCPEHYRSSWPPIISFHQTKNFHFWLITSIIDFRFFFFWWPSI